LDLRTKALSIHDKVKQARQIHEDMKKLFEESERLENLLQEKRRDSEALSRVMQKEGVKLRKYKHVYTNGEMLPQFTDARLRSSRLARINRVADF